MGIAPELLNRSSQRCHLVVPPGIRFAYADLNALLAVDTMVGRDNSCRDAESTRRNSPDQSWIVYRTYDDAGLKIWAVRWSGEPAAARRCSDAN